MSRGETALALAATVAALATAAGCGASSEPPNYVKQVDAICATRATRASFTTPIRRLAKLPTPPYARVAALRTVGKALDDGVGTLAGRVRAVEAPGSDQPVVHRWLDDLRRLAHLATEAAISERSIINIANRRPDVFARPGKVGNADLNHARAARRAAARTARNQGLAKCARLVAPQPGR